MSCSCQYKPINKTKTLINFKEIRKLVANKKRLKQVRYFFFYLPAVGGFWTQKTPPHWRSKFSWKKVISGKESTWHRAISGPTVFTSSPRDVTDKHFRSHLWNSRRPITGFYFVSQLSFFGQDSARGFTFWPLMVPPST